MTIDWSQPICLDTVPPRDARWTGGRGFSSPENYNVEADWEGGGEPYEQFVRPDGVKFTGTARSPRVRNLTPAELAARDGAPADIAAELAAFVGRIAGMSDTECDFADMAGMAGFEDGFALRDAARAALAKLEARK